MNPRCAVVSDCNLLSLALVKRLATNNLDIFVVTSQKNDWRQKLLSLGVSNVDIINTKKRFAKRKYFDYDKISYAIFIDLDGKKHNIARYKKSKNVLITRTLFDTNQNFSKIIYIGELLDDEVDRNQSLVIDLIYGAQKQNSLHIQHADQVVYVSNIAKLIDPLTREIFTYSDGTVLIGEKTSLYAICKELKNILSIEVLRDSSVKPLHLQNDHRVISVNLDIHKALQKISDKPLNAVSAKKLTLQLPMPRLKPRLIIGGGLATFSLLFLPYFILVISGTCMLLVGSLSLRGKLNVANKINTYTSKSAWLSRSMFLTYSRLVVVGDLYADGYSIADLIYKVSEIGTDSFLALNYAGEVSKKVLGASDTDIETLSNQLYLIIDDVYKKSSFLVDDLNKYSNFLTGQINGQTIQEGRNYLYNAREITSNLPLLLGMQKPQTYMVLFQNNMELRPTGGFIGSFALITLDKGKIVEQEVYDVYSADGQLKGYVKPPDAIRKYLGEASWYLRDSNWDPDFATSAKRAEWFLDKSIDRKVDGVIGINLEVIKSLIEITGPIELADYNDALDTNNFYEKIQNEVEDEFFPGSRRKANYLTALSSAAVNRLSNLNGDNQVSFYKSMLSKINSRDIQIYLHNETAAEAMSNLSWDGSLKNPECLIDNCEEVVVGLVEANVGVNKANTNVNRDAKLFVEIADEYIDYKLAVTIKNGSQSSEADKYRYKNYMRVITRNNVEFMPIQIFSGDEVYSQAPEVSTGDSYAYAGVLVDTLPHSESRVVYNWRTANNLDFDKVGAMEFLIRKQSGVNDMPIEISIKNNVSLTLAGPFRYNTTLPTDYTYEFSW